MALAAAVTILAALSSVVYMGIFTVPEGYVGVVYKFGSLSPRIYNPGLNFKVPVRFNSINTQFTSLVVPLSMVYHFL